MAILAGRMIITSLAFNLMGIFYDPQLANYRLDLLYEYELQDAVADTGLLHSGDWLELTPNEATA